jgi:hypothetical protein
VQGVGPGSLLGGRYLVQRRVSQHSRYERWAAADQTLDRDVVLLCFDADGPVASPALDAARRAAGVEEPRLVRVLDVGRDDAIAFVVEESLNGARSVTSVLDDGGLPAEEARRIVGEAASALERARARGLHHSVLTTRSVFRMQDGSIKVRGLATEAALVEADDVPPDQATRGDTVALVALSYALLTGRWPLPGPDSGLEAAPRVVGGIAAPSEIAVGVPADLDFVARRTLSENAGPQTPGELVDQIGPWSPTAVGAGLEVGPYPRIPGNRTEPLDRDRGTGGVARPTGRAGPANGRVASGRGGTGPRAAGVSETAALDGVAGAAGTIGAAGASATRGGGAPRSVLGMNLDTRRPDTPPAPGEDPGEETSTPDAYGLDGLVSYGPYEEGDEGYDDGTSTAGGGASARASAVAAGAAAGTAKVAKGLGTALGAAGSLAAKAGGRVGGMARGAADRAAERSAIRAERRQTERWEDPLIVGEQVRLSETLEPTDEQLEPALPLIPGTAQEPLDKEQSRLVLVLVAVFVLLAAGLGIWGLPRLTGFGGTTASPPVVTQTVTATPSATAGAPPPSASAPPTSSAPAAPIAIVAASQVSEDAGVQAAKNGDAAFDGDGDTLWRSSKWYASPQYGGYEGRTTGLLLDLGQSVDVHQVTFTTRGASDVTVYVGDQTKVGSATQIGSVSQKDGESTVSVPNGGAAKGRYVILWFTALAPDGDAGHFRAQIAEASVK